MPPGQISRERDQLLPELVDYGEEKFISCPEMMLHRTTRDSSVLRDDAERRIRQAKSRNAVCGRLKKFSPRRLAPLRLRSPADSCRSSGGARALLHHDEKGGACSRDSA
jgi:hypothetical protein